MGKASTVKRGVKKGKGEWNPFSAYCTPPEARSNQGTLTLSWQPLTTPAEGEREGVTFVEFSPHAKGPGIVS